MAPVVVRGDETILVVEDNHEVLAYSSSVLEELGYRVLKASSGAAALELLRSDDSIDLLFSDVVLAGGMSGTQLVDAAVIERPDLRVLFTSGFARDGLEGAGRIDAAEIIGKPFTFTDLAARIRGALASSRRRRAEPLA